MKISNLISVIILLIACTRSVVQVWVGNVDINADEKIRIVEVLVAEKLTRKSVNVFVDFGQKTNFKVGNLENDETNQRIIDPETKKEMAFVSSAALLSFMESNNWEHYESVVFPGTNRPVFYYYFRKRR